MEDMVHGMSDLGFPLPPLAVIHSWGSIVHGGCDDPANALCSHFWQRMFKSDRCIHQYRMVNAGVLAAQTTKLVVALVRVSSSTPAGGPPPAGLHRRSLFRPSHVDFPRSYAPPDVMSVSDPS
ncbi:hypothetical protein BHE74_00011116 [Ensete ventricosum]|nr:hypothetical protein BHE74_00011116 [Ensete ventricosum]